MPYKSEKIPLSQEQDRRVKLTTADKEKIRKRYSQGGCSLNSLAREYGVSKKSILLIVNPDSKAKNDQRIKDHWRDYHDRENSTRATRETRRYKQDLYLKGELKESFKLRIVESVGGDIWELKTHISDYDEMLDPNEKEYWKEKKNRVAHIEWMTPDKYVEMCAEYGFNEKTTVDKLVSSREKDKEANQKLIDIINNGGKFWLPYINLADSGQEGLHRVLLAKQWGYTKVPVLVIDVYDKELEQQWDEESRVNAIVSEVDYRFRLYGLYNKRYEDISDMVDWIETVLDEIKKRHNYPWELDNDSLVDQSGGKERIPIKVADLKLDIVYDFDGDDFTIEELVYRGKA